MPALTGKTALVTGSTSGIGHAIASALAEAGANVMLNGFGERDAIERIGREFAAKHRRIKSGYSPAPTCRSPPRSGRWWPTRRSSFGSVDILVNNAGIQFVAPIVDFPEDKWDAIVAVNLSAAFHATKAALPLMKKKRWGRVINTASAHGLVASVEKVAYVAAKHGIVGLTKVTALEAANDGITCNAFCPGWVRTPLVEKQIEARAKARANRSNRRPWRWSAKSRRCGPSSRSSNWPRWCCSCAAPAPTPSPAPPSRWTAAGPRSDPT